MNNYNFSTLNDKEFEHISKDLLNAKFNLNLQSFKVGKDKGIDLRYSTSKNNNSIVVQAKHYINSKYPNLKSILKTKELSNIILLKPDRYIIVTSLSLSALQKDEIKTLMSPFILSSNDIIGQDELNDYLNDFEEIEKKYYKLWLSSTKIINRILNNAVESRTKYFLNQIKLKIKYYVITEKLNEANEILKKEKILVITGQPGIGKTSLAEIIVFDRAKYGFKIFKVENIKEAEDLISLNDKEKQFFYFDDFLGANYSEIINSHKTETQLTNFVDRIRNTPNKYLILTTRTVILNYATENYEKISHSNLSKRQFELKLDDYTKYEKALILYNHFYYRKLDEKFYNVILQEKFYWEIIKHDNYTPRIIEFITDSDRINDFSVENYKEFILNNLKNPKEIWRYSFNNQITYLDRCLLFTLFTFRNEVDEKKLIIAFEKRLDYEKLQHNQIIEGNQFINSVKILLNGFISSTLYNYTNSKRRIYKFINPSLADFLIGFISDSFSERKDIISSINSIEQLYHFNPKKQIFTLELELQKIIRDKIKNNDFHSDVSSFKSLNHYYSKIVNILTLYCPDVNVDLLTLQYFEKIDFIHEWDYSITIDIKPVLISIKDSPQTVEFINTNFYKITERLIELVDSEYEAEYIIDLFYEYEKDFNKYLISEEGKDKIYSMIENIIITEESELADQIKSEVTSLDQVNEINVKIADFKDNLIKSICPIYESEFEFDTNYAGHYWDEIIDENIEKERMTKYDSYDDDGTSTSSGQFDNDAIDDLFN